MPSEHPAPSHVSTHAELPDYSSKRLLAAEDNAMNQAIVSLLAKFHNRPDVAENGQCDP